MLRPRIFFLLRRNTPVLMSALANNLHTAQAVAGISKAKQNKACEPVPVAVILCGCGLLDGTEISEAISAAIHIRQKGMKPLFYAPDVELCGLVNHLIKGLDTSSPPRNALVEAARLARSCVKPLCECEACTHGALIIPGGLGVAKTLSNFLEKGSQCTVLPDMEKLIEDFYCEKKPIGTMCLASMLVAKVLNGVKVTLGKESPKEEWPYAEVIKKVQEMGAKVEMKDVKSVTICKKYNVYSTPAWLYECATYSDIHEGIGKLIAIVKKNVKRPT